jgi:GrpB-like predicted nucleotidyltransferase (UPF0157 family)
MRMIGPYLNAPAACLNYDSRAPLVAQQVAALIAARLPDVIVEHIGSTAVPGCAGKGVVDLMLLYPPGRLAAAKRVLVDLGFQPQSTRDPFPEERPMRLGAIEHDGTTFRLHVHVLAADSPEVAELRAFRDRLRVDPQLRAAYVARKREILRAGISDTVDYSIAKGDFCVEVVGRAK